jgi:hypothetical protein
MLLKRLIPVAPCLIAGAIKAMLFEAKEDLITYEHMQTDFLHGITKRQLGILLGAVGGFALRPMISKITNGLFGSDDDIQNYVNTVRINPVIFFVDKI